MASKRTIAHIMPECAARHGDRLLQYHREHDRWVPVTWREAEQETIETAMGLWTLGCRKGVRVAVISETRAEWMAIDLGTVRLGGITVGIYPTNTAEQTAYILKHSEAKIVAVENAGQLRKLDAIRADVPGVEKVVLFDDTGAAPGDWLTLPGLRDIGREALATDPDRLQHCLDDIDPEDVAMLVYTSGTTGPPKGVVLTQSNIYEIAERAAAHMGLTQSDHGVVFLPLAHSLQRVATYTGLLAGTTSHIAESLDKLSEAWLAAQPTVMSSVPRIFEKIHARIMNGLEQQPPWRRALFHKAMAVGYARSRYIQQSRPIPIALRLRYAFYDKLVFSRVRARLFGNRMRFLVSGGAPISKELLEFFHALGILITEGYGLTETSAPATLNKPDNFRFGTVGLPLPGVEIKIAGDGEILIRGPGVFKEYYKDPEATAAAFTEDGFFKSGDIGDLDADGFLRITDRKKDLIVTASGKNIAPQNLENLIKADPRISQAMVYGDRKPYLVALITLDSEEMVGWTERKGIATTDAAALAADDSVRAMVDEIIAARNATLAPYETIKKFRILPEDFTVDNGMLTPTLKLKRRAICDHYGDRIEQMYAEARVG